MKKKITQKKIAEAAGIKPQTLRRIVKQLKQILGDQDGDMSKVR
jgi:transcriptional regulator with XRE-family HTH domain